MVLLKSNESEYRFVNLAVTTAYVALHVASVPAKTCITHAGPVDNVVYDGVMDSYQDQHFGWVNT